MGYRRRASRTRARGRRDRCRGAVRLVQAGGLLRRGRELTADPVGRGGGDHVALGVVRGAGDVAVAVRPGGHELGAGAVVAGGDGLVGDVVLLRGEGGAGPGGLGPQGALDVVVDGLVAV